MKLQEVNDPVEQQAKATFRKVMLALGKELVPWKHDSWKPVKTKSKTIQSYGAFYKKRDEPFVTAILTDPAGSISRKKLIAITFDGSHFTKDEVIKIQKELLKIVDNFSYFSPGGTYTLTAFV